MIVMEGRYFPDNLDYYHICLSLFPTIKNLLTPVEREKTPSARLAQTELGVEVVH